MYSSPNINRTSY